MKSIVRRFAVLAALTGAVLLTGCATRTKMAFEDDAEKLTPTSKPVFLMTATIKNDYKTGHQPKLLVVNVEKPGAKDASDRFNFTMDDKARIEGDDAVNVGNSYLLRMELPAGDYNLVGLTSLSRSFLINGFFFTPLHSTIKSAAPGVYYLGHVQATVRERKGDEFKAGSTIPLLDQAVVGASGGTFDVAITDEFAKDEKTFKSKFPALANVEIKKMVLPAFDRANAQKWWETH